MVLGRPAAHIDTDLGDQPVEDVLACVIVLLRPALVPACLRWATPRDGPWAPVACRPGTRHTERRGTKTRTKESRNVRRHSASEWACSRPPRAALPEGTLERMCKPADGDTNGGLTAGVTREGPVSFVPHVVPHPPVEQLGLLDLARGCRRESSVLGDCSASPRTPVPPAVLRKHGCPLPTGPHGRGLAPDTHGAVHGARDPQLIKLPPRGACVDVTPNLVWIAQVGDRVQVLHDRGHVLAHEAEDVMTEVRTRPREHGLLMAGSGLRSARSRDRRGDRLSRARR